MVGACMGKNWRITEGNWLYKAFFQNSDNSQKLLAVLSASIKLKFLFFRPEFGLTPKQIFNGGIADYLLLVDLLIIHEIKKKLVDG